MVIKILIPQQKHQTFWFSVFPLVLVQLCCLSFFPPFPFLSCCLFYLVSLPLTFSNVKILSDGLFERLRDRLDVDCSERQRKHESILHQRRSWSTSAAKPSKHVVDIACRLVVPHPADHSRVLNFVFQVHPKSDALLSQIKVFLLVIRTKSISGRNYWWLYLHSSRYFDINFFFHK